MVGTARRAVRPVHWTMRRAGPRTAGKLGRALPNLRFPIYEGVRYGRGAGVGLDRETGVDLGVVVAVGVGDPVPVGVAVAVAVGVDVGVAVAVGVGEPEGAQYLPPVLK